MISKVAIAGCCGAALAGLCWLSWPRPVERATGQFSQGVYVWQRAWNPPVLEAVAGEASRFSRIVVLAAEVSWQNGQPRAVQAPLNHEALLRSGRPIGLAMRIGPFAGPFAANDERARWLSALAHSLVAETEGRGVAVAEVQIDFDCAESKLAGYARWVEAIRRAVAPRPVVITALPSWLKRPAMAALVGAADGFVLQVHSLERPTDIQQPLTLCDPAAAAAAAERAARLGRPFWVALPTYGYLTAFGPSGNFLGLSAEGPLLEWPEGAATREVRADPGAMAALIRRWTVDRPRGMEGVIWYRLPVRGDRWNWSWPTLATVMAGGEPRACLEARLRRADPGLVEVELANIGSADHAGAVELELRWEGARRVASDALAGFDLEESGRAGTTLLCRSRPESNPLPAGETRPVCWLRLDKETEVTVALR